MWTGWRRYGLAVLVFLVLNWWVASTIPQSNPRVTVPYSPTFLSQVQAGNVVRVNIAADAIKGDLARPIRYPDAKAAPSTRFATRQPTTPPGDPSLLPLLRSHSVVISYSSPGAPSVWLSLLVSLAPTLLFALLILMVMRRAAAGANVLGFGKARAHRYEETGDRITFADVAGIDEATDELAQIVDFLRDPEKYRRLGGRIPRGVLLTGPPGTGKTLLARAVAGEARVPFFSLSASEFIEMIVGVGASRVRDLFAQAKEHAPAIIFIDELDAIGRSRSNVVGFGGSDEREQTLNQILTEMDGFDQKTGVIVLASTNRPDVLDSALLRAGRFDRRVAVQPPDQQGRAAILRVHTRGMPLADDVDLEALASTTPGMVGADLANVANEAALLAASRGHDKVSMSDFNDALERTVLGSERKLMMTKADRERTAYHEAGHALVGMLTPGADPVRKISIIPRGRALGVTFSAPDADRYSYSRDYLLSKIRVALGGRSAERIIYGELTTGAESDIDQLTQIARQMVGRWGMSDAIGPVSIVSQDGQLPGLPTANEASPETKRILDDEVRRLVEQAEREAIDLLVEHRDQLEALTRALVEAETLDGPAAYAAAGVTPPSREVLEARTPAIVAAHVQPPHAGGAA